MKAGDIIICVNDSWSASALELVPNRPKKDSFYVVRDLLINFNNTGNDGVYLEEIYNPDIRLNTGIYKEPCFRVDRFSKVDGLEGVLEEVEELFTVKERA